VGEGLEKTKEEPGFDSWSEPQRNTKGTNPNITKSSVVTSTFFGPANIYMLQEDASNQTLYKEPPHIVFPITTKGIRLTLPKQED